MERHRRASTVRSTPPLFPLNPPLPILTSPAVRETGAKLDERTVVEYVKVLKRNLGGSDSQELSNLIYLLGKLFDINVPPTPQLIQLFDEKFDILINHASTKTDKIKKSINSICLQLARVFIGEVGTDPLAIYHLNKIFKILPPLQGIAELMDEKFFANLFKWLNKPPVDEANYKAIMIIGFKVLDGQLLPPNLPQPAGHMLKAIVGTPGFFKPLNTKLFSQDHRMVGVFIDFLRLCLQRALEQLHTMLVRLYCDISDAGLISTLQELLEDPEKERSLRPHCDSLKQTVSRTYHALDRVAMDYDNEVHRLMMKDCLEMLKNMWVGMTGHPATSQEYRDAGFGDKPHEYMLANYSVLNVIDLQRFLAYPDKLFKKMFYETMLFSLKELRFPLAQAIKLVLLLMLQMLLWDDEELVPDLATAGDLALVLSNAAGSTAPSTAATSTTPTAGAGGAANGSAAAAAAASPVKHYKPVFTYFRHYIFAKDMIYLHTLTTTLGLYTNSKLAKEDIGADVELAAVLYHHLDDTVLAPAAIEAAAVPGGMVLPHVFIAEELKQANLYTYQELRKIQLAKYKAHKFALWNPELQQFNDKLAEEVFEFVREQRVLQLLKGTWVYVGNPLATQGRGANGSSSGAANGTTNGSLLQTHQLATTSGINAAAAANGNVAVVAATSKKGKYFRLALSPDRKLLYYKAFDFKTANKPQLDLSVPGVKAVELKNVTQVRTKKIEQLSGLPVDSPHLINIVSRTLFELISLCGRGPNTGGNPNGPPGSAAARANEKVLFEFYVDTKELLFVWVDGLRILCYPHQTHAAPATQNGAAGSTPLLAAASARHLVMGDSARSASGLTLVGLQSAAGVAGGASGTRMADLLDDTANQISVLEDLRKNVQLLKLTDDDVPEEEELDDVYDAGELAELTSQPFYYG